MDRRASTKKALDNYIKRQNRPRRKNKKPEKEVERLCVAYLKNVLGWDVNVYESKATFNPWAGRFVSASMRAGTCDIQGVTKEGIFVAIELKAPGRLSTFNRPSNHRQKAYLISKINSNAFACVVDSVERLKSLYQTWSALPDQESKRGFLMDSLPK